MNTRQQVTNPPHADQAEAVMRDELSGLLDRHTVLAEDRIKSIEGKMQKFHENMRVAKERARVSLRAFVEATVTLRIETERVGEVLDTLNYGLEHIDDVVKSAGNGKH